MLYFQLYNYCLFHDVENKLSTFVCKYLKSKSDEKLQNSDRL